MKFLFTLLLTGSAFLTLAQEPLIRYNYFEDDFSPFKTYNINFFKLNGKEVSHTHNIRTKLLVEKLHERMQKVDFSKKEEAGDIYFNFHLQVDTLPIAFQRPEGPMPEDVVAEITIDIFDAEYNERLFTSNVYGLLVDDRKNGKIIKKIYRKLFRELAN